MVLGLSHLYCTLSPKEKGQAALGPLQALPHQPPWLSLLVGGRRSSPPPCPRPAGQLSRCLWPQPLVAMSFPLFPTFPPIGSSAHSQRPCPCPSLVSPCHDVTAVSWLVSCLQLFTSQPLSLLRISMGLIASLRVQTLHSAGLSNPTRLPLACPHPSHPPHLQPRAPDHLASSKLALGFLLPDLGSHLSPRPEMPHLHMEKIHNFKSLPSSWDPH